MEERDIIRCMTSVKIVPGSVPQLPSSILGEAQNFSWKLFMGLSVLAPALYGLPMAHLCHSQLLYLVPSCSLCLWFEVDRAETQGCCHEVNISVCFVEFFLFPHQ